jgi:hypothetical protein
MRKALSKVQNHVNGILIHFDTTQSDLALDARKQNFLRRFAFT